MSAPDIWLEGEVVEELRPVEEESHGGHEEGGRHEDQVQHVVVLTGHGNQRTVTVDLTRYKRLNVQQIQENHSSLRKKSN